MKKTAKSLIIIVLCVLAAPKDGAGQTVLKNTFSVFHSIEANDSLQLVGGQTLSGNDTEGKVEHGYLPLSYSLLSVSNIETLVNYTVFPNPFNTSFNIIVESEESDNYYELYSSNGSLVFSRSFSGSSTNVDVSNLSRGIYYVRVYTNDTILFHEKMIKN